MPEIMNIKEFAQISGYSPASISRTFSNKSRVNQKTAAEIMRLAEKYNYRPNRAAAASFGSRTQSIGVIIYSLERGYYSDVFHAIQEELSNHSFLAIYQELDSTSEKILLTLQRLIDHRVDGLIMVDFQRKLNKRERFEINRMRIPFVYIDSLCYTNSKIDSVCSDDQAGGAMVAEHFLKLGHRHLLIFWPSTKNEIRNLQIKKMIEAAGGVCDTWHKESSEELVEIFRRKNHPTAVFGYTDVLSVYLYKIIQMAGLNIPDDVSIVGYGDMPIAKNLYPELTTIRLNGCEIGKRSAQLILDRIYERVQEPRQEMLPVEFILRDSTAPVKKQNKE